MVGRELPGAVASLVTDPAGLGIFTDFDGTLSPIVDDPEAATPLDGVVEVLEDLAGQIGCVAVVSGRPVAFLQQYFGPSSQVRLSGLYGLQSVVGGERVDDPRASAWWQAVDDVVAAARGSGPTGMFVEHKGLSVTLHYREHPEAAESVLGWAERQAVRSGLELRTAKMSVELHPPVGVDKGEVVLDLAHDLHGVCFLGDDVGDLPAYAALDRLRAGGRPVAKVVVRSAELAPELVEVADLTVEGPAGALALLRAIAEAVNQV